MGLLVLLLIVYVLYLHAKIVRTGLKQAESPTFVYDEPALSKPLQSTSDRLGRWLKEGRISAAEHGRLMALIQEDGAKEREEKSP